MSASLVGSEMCIRDSRAGSARAPRGLCAGSARALRLLCAGNARAARGPVSYTHLTLPTICSV
eukprot:15028072-Alexandrium_andersonii.AAC.1